MILPPKQVESGSNEITALPELIKDLAVKGVVFAFDSLNTQKADATPRRRTDGAYKVRTQVPHIAPPQGNAHPEKTIETIVATGNPYIAAVKAKQPTLDDGISQMFTPTETVTQVNVSSTEEKNHFCSPKIKSSHEDFKRSPLKSDRLK